MNYEAEKKGYVSFCGSYCHTCDWFTSLENHTISRETQSKLHEVEDEITPNVNFLFLTGFTGKIRRTFQAALDMVEGYGLGRLIEGSVDKENFKSGLQRLARSSICPGCKAELKGNPEDDRCKIRQCCFQKGFNLCNECRTFPCDLLQNNPGVIKFHCIDNLIEIKEKGIEHWIDKQWKDSKTES